MVSLQNESINGHYNNVKFMCADVTSPDLKISEQSTDLIFSNWLLMYLSDQEASDIEISGASIKAWCYFEFSGVGFSFLCQWVNFVVMCKGMQSKCVYKREHSIRNTNRETKDI